MGNPGLEPGTNRLKAEYSTIELVTRAAFFRWLIYSSTRVYSFVKGLREKICCEFEKC